MIQIYYSENDSFIRRLQDSQDIVVPQASSTAMKWIRKAISFHTCQPLPQAYTAWNQYKQPKAELLPWEGKRSMECVSNTPAFQGAIQGTGFCLTWLAGLTVNLHTLNAWEATKNKRQPSGLWQHQRTCNTAERSSHSSSKLGKSTQLMAFFFFNNSPEKEEQTKPKISIKKEIIKIGAEINEIENR